MNGGQGSLLAGAFLIIALAAVVGWREWLPPGRVAAIVYFLCGATPVVLLFLAKIPPKWFAGSAIGFTIGGTTLLSAFGGRTVSEKAFRLPFLGGFGGALLVLNVWGLIQRVA